MDFIDFLLHIGVLACAGMMFLAILSQSNNWDWKKGDDDER